MSYNFKKLNDVALQEATSENTNVYVDENGEIKRVPASAFGGGSSSSGGGVIVKFAFTALYEPGNGERIFYYDEELDTEGKGFTPNMSVLEIFEAINSGIPVVARCVDITSSDSTGYFLSFGGSNANGISFFGIHSAYNHMSNSFEMPPSFLTLIYSYNGSYELKIRPIVSA